jgi:phospholipid/cholesterol/gamma-HCH transport system substrate-binding protein
VVVDKPNYEAQVGLFVAVAIVLLLGGWSWLKGLSLFHPPQRIYIQFHDVAGLNNNAPVNVNGVRVGTVEKLTLIKKGQVTMALRINTEDVTIPQGATFTIQTQGLVGAKYVEITLPDVPKGDQPLPALVTDPDHPVSGQDPVRVELIANKLATSLGTINFTEVEGRMSKNMERMAKAADSVQEAASKFGGVADDAKGAASNANKFFERGTKSFDKFDAVATGSRNTLEHVTAFTDDWRVTSHKLNKVLDNPALTSDLKETADKALQTVQTLQSTVHDLTKNLADTQMRADLLTAMDRLEKSSQTIYKTMQLASGDKELRSDLKDIVGQARDTMTKVSDLVNTPTFGVDLKSTLINVKKASQDVDAVALQMHQVLGEKRPLMKLMFGQLKGKPVAIPVAVPATPSMELKGEQLADPSNTGTK